MYKPFELIIPQKKVKTIQMNFNPKNYIFPRII